MQKSVFLIFCLFLIISCKKQEKFVKAEHITSKIDSLKTNAEIEKYIGDSDSLYRNSYC